MAVELKEQVLDSQQNFSRLQNQLTSWRNTITDDFRLLLGNVRAPSNLEEETLTYRGITIRGFEISPEEDLGIYHAIWPDKGLWLWTSSQTGIITLIDRLQ
jgi:hypothetical protein